MNYLLFLGPFAKTLKLSRNFFTCENSTYINLELLKVFEKYKHTEYYATVTEPLSLYRMKSETQARKTTSTNIPVTKVKFP